MRYFYLSWLRVYYDSNINLFSYGLAVNLLHESHQLHFFVNNTDIESTPSLISAIKEQFPDFQLVPTYGKEFNPVSGDQKDILILVSSDHSLRIEFPSHEILILKEGGTQEEFKELSFEIVRGLSDLFRFKMGNRVSILSTKFYQGSKEQYEELYKSLFTYKQATPFEWDNRVVERLELPDSKESINSISAIRRIGVRSPHINNGNETDLIVFELDSNTAYQSAKNRFGLTNCLGVYDELYKNNIRLTKELTRYFDA